jgi:SAM domain (Sterile alpha motif)
MDIVVWLRSLGLEKYEAAFRENGVDETVLPKLTAEDVKDLGVIAVGHRRKLLEAIAELRSTKTEPEGFSPAAAAPSKDTAAERRQVTVVFSDLVGSTALKQQACGYEAVECRLQFRHWLGHHRNQQRMRELSANRRSDLRHVLGRT